MDRLIVLSNGAPVSAILLGLILAASAFGLMGRRRSSSAASSGRTGWCAGGAFATLLASGFVHADYAHLFFNAFTFWAFAFDLERAIGSGRFLALYPIGLAASDAGTWIRHRHDPDYATLGASGAILAVLFASIRLLPGRLDLHPAAAGADSLAAVRARVPRLHLVAGRAGAVASTTTRTCRARSPASPPCC